MLGVTAVPAHRWGAYYVFGEGGISGCDLMNATYLTMEEEEKSTHYMYMVQ